MRKGAKIEFSTELGPAHVAFDKIVKGFDTVAQNGIVNIVTQKGSDELFDFRGTTLLDDAFTGYLSAPGFREHAMALAAEHTRLFLRSRENERESPEFDLLRVGIELKEIGLKKIVFNTFFVNDGGEVVGESLAEIFD